jgi:hypothetical protein
MLLPHVWTLVVVIKLMGPSNKAGPTMRTIGMGCVAVVIGVTCGFIEPTPLVAREVFVALWGALLGPFATTTHPSVRATYTAAESSGPHRCCATPS